MPTADEPHIIVDNTMGAAFIGVICAARGSSLVSCVQTWFYFSRYPGVAIVWVFDSIHQALISHTVYFYVVTNFSNPTEQAKLLEVLFNGLIGFLVQSFLTMRVWKKLGEWLTRLCHVVPLFDLTSSANQDAPLKLVTWKDLTNLKSLSMTVNVLGAVSDVIIAAGLFYFLHRSRTGFKNVGCQIMFTVSTGLLTSVCAVASLLSILIWGKTLIYVAFYFMYSNSLLATLNARKGIRGLNVEEGDNVSVSLQTFSNKLRLRPMRNMTMAPNQTNISIKVDTTQELVRDKATKEKDFEFDITDVGKSEDTQSEVV
ncbi:hypothetical protein F5051DRAFT_495410 [Lentinula edodes]|nr:hypothetical protein F5051DRAFT_495410 [Lentinula edodes]